MAFGMRVRRPVPALAATVVLAFVATASRSHSSYVDLRAAFKGPNYTYDETHYL